MTAIWGQGEAQDWGYSYRLYKVKDDAPWEGAMGMRTMRKRPILLSLILASIALVCELIPTISAGALVESVHSTPGCKGVMVTPSDDVQAMLDARPTGTKFCFQAGSTS